MTHKAREVLADCRVALALLEQEEDLQKWRIHWAAALALIRAVGHVLDKVDGRDLLTHKIGRERYALWMGSNEDHEIFREFIDRERNMLLKEYETNVHPLRAVPVAVESTLSPINGGPPVRTTQIFEIGENIYRPLLDGPWEGNDARDILSAAIEWWEQELNIIDRRCVMLRDLSPPT